MKERPRSLEEIVNIPPSAELLAEGGELTNPIKIEKSDPEIAEKTKTNVLVKIGETLREYAPAVITGAAAGALFESANYYSSLLDNRITNFIFENHPILGNIFKHPFVGDSSDKALWLTIGIGLGAIAGGLKKMREAGP